MSVKLLIEHHLEFLSVREGCTGSSEYTHVKMPHCWKSHVAAQLYHNKASEADQWELQQDIEKTCRWSKDLLLGFKVVPDSPAYVQKCFIF